jgi:hypothetical protein
MVLLSMRSYEVLQKKIGEKDIHGTEKRGMLKPARYRK